MSLHSSLLTGLENQYLQINAIIGTLAPTRLTKRPAPDKWSIHDSVAHLARYQVVFIERLNRIQAENAPAFGRYKAEEDPGFEDIRKQSTNELLEFLCQEREKIRTMVLSYSEVQIKRIGVHPKFGNLTVEQWLQFFVLHEAHHIFTIFQLTNDVAMNE